MSCLCQRSNSGEKAFHAKLTNAQAIEIHRRASGGESMAALGREFGISRNGVWNLMNGRAWRRILHADRCSSRIVDNLGTTFENSYLQDIPT